ncbi:MAG: carboxymuconolactone decarboxylase family protein [Caulobacterales bacterium]|nr:carboxymuconolactone decarboxylase family protein [Caulobacterales bacterium]
MLDLPILTKDTAPGDAKTLLDATAKRYGRIPNAHGAFANAPAMLKAYQQIFATFTEDTTLTPIQQNVVFLTVSVFNKCGYCIAAHTSLAINRGGMSEDQAAAIHVDEPLEDRSLETLRLTTQRLLTSSGVLSPKETAAFLEAGHTKAQLLEVIIGVACKIMSNYVNAAMQTPLDGYLEPYRNAAP